MGISRRFKLILGIIIPIFGFFLMSQNTFAVALDTSSFDLYYYPDRNDPYYRWKNNIKYGTLTNTTHWTYFGTYGQATRYQFNTSAFLAGGNYMSLHFETNLVCSYSVYGCANTFRNLAQQSLLTCSSSAGTAVISKNLQYATTVWTSNNPSRANTTLTFYGDVVMSGFNINQSYNFTCAIGSTNKPFFYNYSNSDYFPLYFEQNPGTITWTTDKSAALLESQNAILQTQNSLITQQTEVISDFTDANYQAVDNINGQSSSDIPNSSDQQTTNLIGIISSFVSTISGYGTGSSCSISLPFPQFAGGTQVVNVCNDRDKLAMNNLNYVVIFANLAMICFFVPICFILLRMIYKEIRSWTNG